MGRPVISWDGKRWYQRKDGYFGNSRHGLLHRAIYASAHGPIAPGSQIHHLDHDKTKNAVANLAPRTAATHWAEQQDERGADWHSKGGKAAAAKRLYAERQCDLCGSTYMAGASSSKYCSARCRDNGAPSRAKCQRLCIVCDLRFETSCRRPSGTCSYA